jgi:hypothetical protein
VSDHDSEQARRNPIASFGKDGPVVDIELETFAKSILMPIELDCPQANSLFPPINGQAVLREDFEAQVVKGLVAVPVRPPQPGGSDSNGRARESFKEGAVEIKRSPILNRTVRRELRL